MNITQIEQNYIAALSHRDPASPSFAIKSEWNVPSPEVGDKVNVLFSYTAKRDDTLFSDLCCGDTTVIEVKRNGTVVLANRYMFHKTGYGHAKNNNCVMSANPVHPWNDKNLTPNESAELLEKLGHLPTDIYNETKSD